MQKDKVTTQKIAGIFVVFFLFFGIVFGCFKGDISINRTHSYLESEDYTIGDIKVKGVQLKVYQNNGSGYTDVTDTGFDLNTKTFATDVKYNYDLIIKNDEKAEVTADQYYLRWYFTAIVDNTEYDITQYTTVDSAYVYLQEDTDGKTRYYSVNGNQSNVISAQNQLAFLSSIRFDGVYDNLTKKYGSILDDEFSGSKIKIVSHIEGSLTPYEIILPTVKFYNTDGNILEEITLGDNQTTINILNETPTSSIEVDGQTLYFQGWTKNGQSNIIYTPNQTVEVQPKDVFTPYYGLDPEYSDFTFTQDATTGEYTLAGANKNATSVTIPALNKGDKVTVIKDRAFYSYTKLETVIIPQTITKIGDNAFYGCKNLTSITIPNGVTNIGSSAFSGCTSLTSIDIPDSVTNIGGYVFSGCTSLTTLSVDNSNTKYCAIDNVLYSKDMKNLIVCAGGKIGEVNIPNSVTNIESSAFSGCTNLTTITMPDSVTNIGAKAFYNCASLTSINIPDGVKAIYYDTFFNCSKLTNINIPNSVTRIDNYVFYKCASLTSITIPDGVTEIRNNTFSGCKSLTTITIPDSVKSIGSSAFENCTSLTSVTIGNSVTSIGGSAFENCTSLTTINIPDSVTSIGRYAFDGCRGLTSVTIGKGVTSIGDYAFRSCLSLLSINVNTNNKSYSSQDGVLFNINKTILIRYPAGNSSKSYTIPDSVTNIGEYAFDYCTSLTSVTIGNSVTNIGNHAFYTCTSLTSITIPDSVKVIGQISFQRCSSLTSVTIGNSVTQIGSYCFTSCSKLTNIIFENTTGWNMTTSSSYANGTAIDVTNSATNATNMNSSSGSWCKKYLYRV